MASNTITPDKVKSVLSTFLSTSTKENKTDNSSEAECDGKKKKETFLSPVESAAKSDYFKRIETYSPLTWFGKPRELSPLVCARYGWENTESDMLQCVSCRAVLSGQLPKITDLKPYKEGCDVLCERLISGHEKLCWLAANPTSEKYMIIPLYDVVELRREFHNNLCQLATIKSNLPSLNFENLEKWGFDEEKCLHLAKCQNIRPDAAISATLAITGWTLSADNGKIVVCSYCKRRVGLWNYLSKDTESEKTEDNENDSDEPSRKKRKLEKNTKLDPIMEHRYWCPWVTMTMKPEKESSRKSLEGNNAMVTFKKNESNPGWVNTLQILVPDMAEKVGSTGLSKSPMVEGLRSVRKILRVWSSPEKPVLHQELVPELSKDKS